MTGLCRLAVPQVHRGHRIAESLCVPSPFIHAKETLKGSRDPSPARTRTISDKNGFIERAESG